MLKSEKSITEMIYDNILIIIDKLIKYAHLILFKKLYLINQFKYIVLNRLIQYHNISKEITNDRDKIFISNY